MNRTEELTTKLRTLSYDHERLTSMHHTASEKAESAERETNLFKSRLAYVLVSLMLRATTNALVALQHAPFSKLKPHTSTPQESFSEHAPRYKPSVRLIRHNSRRRRKI